MKVHSALGSGFQEVIYQRALSIEMEKEGLSFTREEDVHLAQAMNYCQAYNLPVGLLINFGSKSLEFKRVYNVNHPENKNYKRQI